MRLVRPGLALALGAALTAAPAPAQVPVPSLAQGEVLLQVGAIGSTTVSADLATFGVSLTGEGETQAAARTALEAAYQRLVAALRQAGVPADAIGSADLARAVPLRVIDVAEEPPPPREEGAAPPPAPLRRPLVSLYATVTVRLADTGRVGAVSAAIDGVLGMERGNSLPVYSLTNNRAARQAAWTQAVASARADAEAHAATLNMRIARMVRVTDRTGIELLPQLFGGDPAILRQAFSGPRRDADIPVFAAVGIDFILAPR